MNLLETRIALIQRTGRYDLVVDAVDYADNGANAYIQEAIRWLDRKYFVDKAVGRFFKKLTAGAYGVIIPDARVIQEVWIADSSSRKQLEKVDLHELRGEDGYEAPLTSLDQGRPLYYAPTNVRMVPESTILTVEEAGPIVGYADVMLSDTYGTLSGASTFTSYNGLMFMPPADGTYSLEVVGLFYSKKLTVDADQNHWSVVYPDVLLMAACRQIEIFNRNTEGVNDWTSAIAEELFGITADGIDQIAEGFDQMEG